MLRSFFENIGATSVFVFRFFKKVWQPPYEFREVMIHINRIGLQTLGLVSITAFIMGLVLTLQSRPTLADFGAESFLPAMVAISIVREIGPVITAIICAGKVGSGIGAELASMRVTEQIEAMEVSGTDPFKYLVVTRTLAATVAIPILVFYADAVAMFGGFVGVNINGDVSITLYFSKCLHSINFSDVTPATIKTIFFGFFIAIISCYKGYNATNGTVGVGVAANQSVVNASLMVFIIDMIAVQITDLL